MLILPWPPAKLSPNATGCWRSKLKSKTTYKEQCYLLGLACKPPITQTLHLGITFHPPDKRHRDLDNMLAAIKYGLDGVAAAWDINDKNFRPITIDIGDPVAKGQIRITII